MPDHKQGQQNLNDVAGAWTQLQATADTHLPRSENRIRTANYSYSPKRAY